MLNLAGLILSNFDKRIFTYFDFIVVLFLWNIFSANNEMNRYLGQFV